VFILILGAPGSGKGTQGKILAERLGLPKITTGDILRAAMKDPGLIAEAKKANIDLDEIASEKIQAILERAYAMPPDVIREAKDAMSLSGAAND